MRSVGLDVHQDTPVEILHTVLLGIVKYYWAQTFHIIDKAKKTSIFQARLGSFNIDGLNIPTLSAEYICQYRGGLIGKHFKSLAQIMPFIIHDLVSQEVLDAWLLIGRMCVLLWHTEIHDLNAYLVSSSSTLSVNHINLCSLCRMILIVASTEFLI